MSNIQVSKPVSIIIEADMPYKIINYDQTLCQMLGYSVSEFARTKRSLYDLMSGHSFRQLMDDIDNGLSVSNYVDTKINLTCKGGSEKIVLFNGQAFITREDRIVLQCSISDVTALEASAAETTKAKSDLDNFANSLPSGVSKHLLDNNLSVFWANKAFYSLTGYTAYDFEARFGRNTFSVIYPPDLAFLIDALADLSEEHDSEANLRITCQNGDLKWVNITLAHAGENSEGFPVINMVMTDITNLKYIEQIAFLEKQKFEILSDITEELPFEYDMTDHILTFAEKFTKTFTQKPVFYKPSTSLIKYGLVCSESVDSLARILINTRNGADYFSSEVLLNTRTGKQWFLCSCSTVRDSEGHPARIVGLLRNINKQKIEQKSLVKKAESDLMTGLLNKTTTEGRIRDKLRFFDGSGTDCLLIFDIDNFKSVNDTYGHLVGDEVIICIADTFREVIDSHHIAGRTGGDEFTIYMSDLSSEEVATAAAAEIARKLKENFAKKNLGFVPTLSIGIAAAKRDITYHELCEHADTAVYEAKLNGKDCYALYHENLERRRYVNNRAGDIIASVDDASSAADNIKFLQDLVNMLAMRQNTYQTIENAFKLIGNHYNIDRLMLFEYDNNLLDTSNLIATHVWNKDPNAEAQLMEKIPSILFDEVAKLSTNGIFYVENQQNSGLSYPDTSVNFRNITGFMQYSITHKKRPIGFISFASTSEDTVWTIEEQEQFDLIFKMLAEPIIARFMSSSIQAIKEDLLSSLEFIPSPVMVVDMTSHDIVYVNPSLKEIIPSLMVGSKCFTNLKLEHSECEDCPLLRLNGNNRSVTSTVYSNAAKIYFRMTAVPIKWELNRRAAIITLTPEKIGEIVANQAPETNENVAGENE